MDLWAHSFLKSLRHANHVYWCIRMKKLHADGSFDPLDFESLETCKSYHMGKMTESLVFSKMELESNLLEVFPRIDQISYAPSTIKIGVCVEHRHDWIMSIAIRLFI